MLPLSRAFVASLSTRSFIGSPECPRTQRHSIRCAFAASSSRRHRSMFATGSPAALRQLRRTQPVCQRVTPFFTYSLSVCSTTRHGRFSASSAIAAAVSSMRLLVVAGSAPDNSLSTPRNRRIAAQPPAPGLGLQPPSVQISTTSDAGGPGVTVTCSDAIGVLVRARQMEAQTAQIFQRILPRHQRARPACSANHTAASAGSGSPRPGTAPAAPPARHPTAGASRHRPRSMARALVTLNEKSGSKHQAFRHTATS